MRYLLILGIIYSFKYNPIKINKSNIIWMFGMIYRATKEARVFCDVRTKENLLPLIKNNINTVITEKRKRKRKMKKIMVKTRFYSDCFASYQSNDFKEMGYILHKVKHSVWFGQGSFHKILLKDYGLK